MKLNKTNDIEKQKLRLTGVINYALKIASLEETHIECIDATTIQITQVATTKTNHIRTRIANAKYMLCIPIKKRISTAKEFAVYTLVNILTI